MNTLAKLDQLNLDADTRMQVQMLFEQSQKEIHSQQLKIQALTMELAYLRRNLFGKKSESLSTSHPDLFEETLQSDVAAVNAEIEQLDPSAKVPRSRAGRQPLSDHLLRIEHRHEPESCQCSQCGLELELSQFDGHFFMESSESRPVKADCNLSRFYFSHSVFSQNCLVISIPARNAYELGCTMTRSR